MTNMASLKLVASLLMLVSFIGVNTTAGFAPNGARDLAQTWLREKQASIGFDEKSQSLVVLESASIGVSSKNPMYIITRQAAFDIAMQQARKSAAEFLAGEIKTAITLKKDMHASFDQVMGDPKIVDAVVKQAQKEKFVINRKVEDYVSVVARAAMAGLAPWNTFESSDGNGAGEIAIIAVLSPKYAEGLRGKPNLDHKSQALTAWFDGMNDADLLCTVGSRSKYDETGMLRAVAFGQARIRPGVGMEDHAIDEAQNIAIRDLALVHGEQVASDSFNKSLMAQKESSDLPESFRSTKEFESAVAANANVRNIAPRRIAMRTIVDPISGEKLIVVLCNSGAIDSTQPTQQNGDPVAQGDCPAVPANMVNATRQIRVKGTGASRNAAVEAALMEAVRQEGVSVKGNSRLEKKFAEAMESVGNEVKQKVSASTKQESTVETFANGFIYSYAKISETRISEIFEVGLCVNLVHFDPNNPRFGLPATVAVLPFACAPNAQAARGKIVTMTEQALQSVLLESKKYQVIDAQNEPKLRAVRQDIADRVMTGKAQEIEALKLGNELTADFVLIGNIIELSSTGQAGASTGLRVTAVVDARLINVSNGALVWSEPQSLTMDEGELMEVRFAKNPQDPKEPNMQPYELVCSRAARALANSLIQTLNPQAKTALVAVSPSDAIIRVVGKVVTLNAAFPGVKVGAKFAVKNPVRIDLPGGKTEIDFDSVGKILVTSVKGGLAKADSVEGDPDLITVGQSELVLLPN